MSQVAPDSPRLSGELREPRLRERLAILLARDIVSGRLGPGAPFPSAEELVNDYGVSRTVARETVQTLSMLGLLNVQHGKRTEVCPPESWDILSAVVQEALRQEGKAAQFLADLYEFRLLIEPDAAALMAERGSAEAIDELTRLADMMVELSGQSAAASVVMDADRDFHNVISQGSGNRVLTAVSRDIREVMTTLWALSELGPEEIKVVAQQHRTIADAVARRSPSAAAAAMREHLSWASKLDLKDLERTNAARDQ